MKTKPTNQDARKQCIFSPTRGVANVNIKTLRWKSNQVKHRQVGTVNEKVWRVEFIAFASIVRVSCTQRIEDIKSLSWLNQRKDLKSVLKLRAAQKSVGGTDMKPISITMDAGAETSAAFPVVLKKIMETPPPNLLEGDDENDKEKLFESVESGGVSEMGPSAALTPAIWEKTIPYDGDTFHLEYMDLEEFLMENGIAAAENEQKSSEKENIQLTAEEPSTASAVKTAPAVTLLPVMALDPCEEEVVTITTSSSSSADNKSEENRMTPDPINPDEIEVDVNFEPDPTDLVLSSIPGGELFDPRKHRFSEEELKPQPMIKKAKKVFVPEDQKDDKYWQRRKKNNVAAKRSRDARRLKENQITVRAAFLERENSALRQEVAELRKDFGRCKNTVARYEAKYGALGPEEDVWAVIDSFALLKGNKWIIVWNKEEETR